MEYNKPSKAITDYYDSVKHLYPDVTRSQFDDICRAEFRMLKEEMQKGSLKTVRIKYFGSFLVFRGRAKGLYNKTKRLYSEGKVTKEILEYIKLIVTEYLKREHDEDLSH